VRCVRSRNKQQQLCKDAIVDQYRDRSVARPDVDALNPDVQVQVQATRSLCGQSSEWRLTGCALWLKVFVHEGLGTINMDTSVLPLHMRGYRRESVEAPMRETLAAHILHMADVPRHMQSIVQSPRAGS
jgi:23S rRNA G2445 N2-methylase RlmL